MNLVKLIYYALTSVIKEMNIIMASRVDKVVSLHFMLAVLISPLLCLV